MRFIINHLYKKIFSNYYSNFNVIWEWRNLESINERQGEIKIKKKKDRLSIINAAGRT